MNKILVEIICPATQKNYDFLLPEKMTVRIAIEKVRAEIIEYEQNEELFPEAKEMMLWNVDSREILPRESTLEQAGIYGGNRLFFL